MSKLSERIEELESKIARFIDGFELVFDNDWLQTEDCIQSGNWIDENGTFINPGTDNEDDGNWSNRVHLLDAYRELKLFLQENDLYEENI